MSSSKITQDEVWRIARLARLSPNAEQARSLAADLSRILDYVTQLDQVDTSQVEATPSTVRASALRSDEVVPGVDREEVLAAAPASHDGGFSVPKVLEVET